MEYAYRDSTADSPGTTGQIASITVGTNGASRGYTYTYDANGNILSVTEGNETTSYTYDKAGQLLRENNQAAGKTWVWKYDNSGNIETRTEYAYTTGSLGEVLDTVTYAYDNDNWGDLLTAYDGQTITYDQIGNPLNDGTWEYTWEHGRQLSSMTDGTMTLDFQYNADGIRTRKTVITASDHSHIFQARTVAPTCTENGYTLHECACGFSWQSDPVVSTGHTFVATEVEATCTAHGYTLMECECGYGYQEGTSGHTFTDTVVAPTAEENGYTLHECACGYSYQDTPVAALGITNSSAGDAANTVVYDYIYNGSSLTYLTVTTTPFGQDSTTETLYFGNGTVTYNGTVYYYVTNLQGDVVSILNAAGNPVVQYTYDAWGKILSISGPMADTLGAVNPLTYRGYVYDTETDLYYLESRYYDPAMSRFINGDAFAATGQRFVGNNMFAYCLNNPIVYSDSVGYAPRPEVDLRQETHGGGAVEIIVLYDGDAISMTICQNKYYIDLYIEFTGPVDPDFLAEGIEKYWEGTYTDQGYTFSLYFNVHQGPSSEGHSITVNTYSQDGRSYCTPNPAQWKDTKETTITLYEDNYQYIECDWTFAHEIGHSLGVGDYYSATDIPGFDKNYPSIMNIPGMHANSRDAHMVIWALRFNSRMMWLKGS